jgi:hypothetical protein
MTDCMRSFAEGCTTPHCTTPRCTTHQPSLTAACLGWCSLQRAFTQACNAPDPKYQFNAR